MSDPIIMPNTESVVVTQEGGIGTPPDPQGAGSPSEFDDAFDVAKLEQAIATPDKEKAETAETPASDKADVDSEADTKIKLDLKPKDDDGAKAVDEIKEDAAVPRTSADWKKFRSAYNETRALLKDRDAKIAELSKGTESLKQLEAIQKERDELAVKYKELSVIGDPELTKDVDTKIDLSLNSAKRGLDAKKAAMVETIARMPDSDARTNMLNELLEDMPPAKQMMLGSHLANLEQLTAERDARLADARKNADSVLAKRQQMQEQTVRQRREQLDRAFVEASGSLKSKDGWSDIFGDKDVAAAVEASAKQIFNGDLNDPRALAEKAIFAATTPLLMNYAIGMAKELAVAQKVIAELKAAGPSMGAERRSSGKAADAGVDPFSPEALARIGA